jgi:hypothetical protein
MKGLLLGLVLAIAVSCAAQGGHKATTASPPPVSPQDVLVPNQHTQIDELEQKITDARVQMGLPPVPDLTSCGGAACPHIAAMSRRPSVEATCTHAQNETCTSACTLADSICDNAGKICDLADKLKPDPWAEGKCTTSHTSCDEASKHCCGCS